MILSLSKRFTFCASHILCRPEWDAAKNTQKFGKCANPNGHGHNYSLEVSVAGSPDDETSMVIDASRLDRIVSELVITDLDHKNLNLDVSWLSGKMPTVEVVAKTIWERLEPAIQRERKGIWLHRVKLSETERIFAVCERGDLS